MLRPASTNFLNDNKFDDILFAAMTSVSSTILSGLLVVFKINFPLPSIRISAFLFLLALFINLFSHFSKLDKISPFLIMCSVAPESAIN